MRSFAKMKHRKVAAITLSFTDIGKLCPSHDFLTSQMCLLTLFAKLKFSQKFEFTVAYPMVTPGADLIYLFSLLLPL